MEYKQSIKQAMEELARDERVLFIGYNISRGSRAYGTLAGIPIERCLETPLAENLMTDLAIGMALEGFRPVLFFERHDFIPIALDALLNHLDKIDFMSNGQFKAPVIIRATVGGSKPINPGPQHTQDLSGILKKTFHFPVYELVDPGEIVDKYRAALIRDEPTMFIERREWYGKTSS